MYADQVEGAGKRSVKERLSSNSFDNSIPRRQTTGKRQRQDEKWEHDLYQDDVPQVSNRKVDARDLRLKLQRKSLQQVSQSGKGALSGVRDLRDKLSGTMNPQPVNADPPKLKSDVTKPTRRTVAVETSEPEPKKAATTAAKKKAQQKADASVEDFLQSLGLEKYAITFQVEEVDMTALVHMTDDDLKALGIPMVTSSEPSTCESTIFIHSICCTTKLYLMLVVVDEGFETGMNLIFWVQNHEIIMWPLPLVFSSFRN